MNSNAKLTCWIITAIVGILCVYDVYCTANDVPGDTISEVMLKVARDHPILPMALGILLGHLFWPQKI